MQRKSKWLAVMLAAMVIGVTACGDSGNGQSGGTDAAEGAGTASPETGMEATSEESSTQDAEMHEPVTLTMSTVRRRRRVFPAVRHFVIVWISIRMTIHGSLWKKR